MNLASKYRPKKLDDLVGQDVIVKCFSNAIKQDKILSTFLFTGAYGVGKTTTARIIALSINCENGPTIEPCGICSNCHSIILGSNTDVIEIDAASNTGVDDMREIINDAKYTPSCSLYKIYIIDEAHMLSKNAFNSLLKTLEEPPENAKFILATTEINKLPDTIISRCQCFMLKRIPDDKIINTISSIAKKEKIEIDSASIKYIAQSSKGSMRDAISLLEQASIYSSNDINIELITKMMCRTSEKNIEEILTFILDRNTLPLIEILTDLYHNGCDPILLIEELLRVIHKKMLSVLKEHKVKEQYMRVWQATLSGLQEVKKAPDLFVATQMLFIRLCYLANLPPLEQILNNQNVLKEKNIQTNLTDNTKKDYNVDTDELAQEVLKEFPNASIIDSSKRNSDI